MNVQVITSGNTKTSTRESAIFDQAANPTLVSQAVRVYLANQRAGLAKTKTRGEVDLTKKKMYKQKHTGGARHGAQSAPIFVGGGVTHGPRGNQNWTLTLSKKMRQVALKTALGMQASQDKIIVVDGIEKIQGKTKEMVTLLRQLELTNVPTLLVAEGMSEILDRATRNIENLFVCLASDLTTYYVMRAGKIIFTPTSLDQLEARLAKPTKEEKTEVKAPVVEKKTKVKTEAKAEVKMNVEEKVKKVKVEVKKSVKKTTRKVTKKTE